MVKKASVLNGGAQPSEKGGCMLEALKVPFVSQILTFR